MNFFYFYFYFYFKTYAHRAMGKVFFDVVEKTGGCIGIRTRAVWMVIGDITRIPAFSHVSACSIPSLYHVSIYDSTLNVSNFV